MGDSRRNEVFSAFIRRNFSPKRFRSVLVVADGHGELAVHLSSGYRVRVLEPRPRQKTLRKRVTYVARPLEVTTAVHEDFIVGMHPDEATALIVEVASRLQKRFAIVPCCIKGEGSGGVHSFEHWLKKLRSLSNRPVSQTLLPISGKNTVLWTP